MTAHRHWRIWITATGGESYVQFQELEFAALGAAKYPNGTPSASSNYPGSTAAAAFDGTSVTWLSDGGALPQWVAMDFGAPVDVSVVRLRGYNGGRKPKNFDVQYSDDGATWTTAWSVANLPDAVQWIQLPNPALPIQIIRLLSTYGDYSAIAAIELATVPAGPTVLPPGQTSLIDAITYGGGIATWFDGNPATFEFLNGNGWARIELPVKFGTLAQLRLQRSASDSRMMTSFKLQTSLDGLAWADFLTISGLAGWGASEVRTWEWEPSIVEGGGGSDDNTTILLRRHRRRLQRFFLP